MHTHTHTHTCTQHTHVQNGYTALLLAADQEHEDVVQLLIELDADPDLQDEVIDHQMICFKSDCGGCIVMWQLQCM